MKNRFLLLAPVLILVLAMTACSGTSTAGSSPQPANSYGNTPPTTTVVTQESSSSSPAEITIANFSFSPDTLTIKAGTTVTWTNQDSAIHTVTSETGVFESGNLSKGDTFSYTFDTAGSYAYHCTPHGARMSGTIVVTD